MNVWQSLIFGALQGVTEFLPVSSSGHLVVLRFLWDLREIPILFDILLHVSTLLVVLLVFRGTVWRILRAVALWIVRKSGDEERPYLRTALLILRATVITGIIGVGVDMLDMEGRPKAVAALFLVTAAVLVLSSKLRIGGDAAGEKPLTGVICGIAQGLGVFPGISRSGITISAALMSGLDRQKAGELGFLLSIPAIAGALVLKIGDSDTLSRSVEPLALAAGIAAAFIVGLLSLTALLRIVRSGKLHLFAYYLVPLGIAGLIFF